MRWYLRHRGAAEAPAILRQLGGGPYPRILDVGCATGIWLADVYRRGHGHQLLAGVDVGELMVAEARVRLAKAVSPGTEVKIEHCSALEMPFDDASFDAIMSNGMVKHLDDDGLARFLAEARRSLVAGGRLSVWDFGRPLFRLPDVKVENPAMSLDQAHLRTGDVLAGALAAAGFANASPYMLKRPWRLPVTLEGAVGTRP